MARRSRTPGRSPTRSGYPSRPTPRTASPPTRTASPSSSPTFGADNHFRGVDDLDDTITRLRAYAAAGADVVYAPGLRTREQIRAVRDAVDVPVNVLAMSGVPPVGELAALGVARVSVGASFAMTAYSALLDAGRELQDGTYGFCDRAATGRAVVRGALG